MKPRHHKRLFALCLCSNFSLAACETTQTTDSESTDSALGTQVIDPTLVTGAEAGDPESQFKLGEMYEWGWGAPKNYTESARWFRQAAEQGHAEAQYSLGVLYEEARGVPRSDTKACDWYVLAGAQGHSSAALKARNVCELTQQQRQALIRAAEKRKALISAGEMRQAQVRAEEKRQARIRAKKKRQVLIRAAERGDAEAQYALARSYSSGEGAPQDSALAFKWYQRAAEAEHSAAQYELAKIYHSERDLSQAAKWYQRAAEVGHTHAYYKLAQLHASGEVRPPDPAEAAEFLRAWHEGLGNVAVFATTEPTQVDLPEPDGISARDFTGGGQLLGGSPPQAGVILLGLTAGSVILSAVTKPFTEMRQERVKKKKQAVAKVDVQEILNQEVLAVASAKLGSSVRAIERPYQYSVVNNEGTDLVLEVFLQEIVLTREMVLDEPPFGTREWDDPLFGRREWEGPVSVLSSCLRLEIGARLIDTADAASMNSSSLKLKGACRTISGWLADDARKFRDAVRAGIHDLANRTVQRLFELRFGSAEAPIPAKPGQ